MKLTLAWFLLLFLAACGFPLPNLAARSPAEQDQATVEIRTTCTATQKGGTGSILSPHTILTAEHVLVCADGKPAHFTVRGHDRVWHEAKVALLLPDADIGVLRTTVLLNFTPVTLGPTPRIGQIICESAAVPRPTYRCDVVQTAWKAGDDPRWKLEQSDGDVRLDMYVEFGNSGSAVYDQSGRLVGVMVMRQDCSDEVPCIGYVSSLWPRAWILSVE